MEKHEIEKKVFEDVSQIADKYDISITDILKILSFYETKDKTEFLIRFSDSELKIINERSAEKNLSKGSYCALCFQKAIDDKLYENMDLIQISKRMYHNEVRRNRVHISIKRSGVSVADMVRFAELRGLEISSLIRYFSLNVFL